METKLIKATAKKMTTMMEMVMIDDDGGDGSDGDGDNDDGDGCDNVGNDDVDRDVVMMMEIGVMTAEMMMM
jgi:hypothetical protein